MATELRLRRGTTAQHSTFVGAMAEVTVDTTTKSLVVHDGVTPGGNRIPSPSEFTDLLATKQDALGFTPENAANKGQANGYAPLDADSKVPAANLPDIADSDPTLVSIAYNPDGSVATVTEDGVATTLAYNPDGTINTASRPKGGLTRTETFGYSGGRLTTITATET